MTTDADITCSGAEARGSVRSPQRRHQRGRSGFVWQPRYEEAASLLRTFQSDAARSSETTEAAIQNVTGTVKS